LAIRSRVRAVPIYSLLTMKRSSAIYYDMDVSTIGLLRVHNIAR
jgi:hypothetical protein